MNGTVILTRSATENERVMPVFESAGFTVICAPAVELRLIDVDPTRSMRALEHGGGVVLTSGLATERWIALRHDLFADLPIDGYFVVGKRSAAMLRISDPDTPIAAVADSSAELLASKVKFPSQLLYPGSRARREDLVSGLRLLGSQVTDLPMYEPVLPSDGGRSFVVALRSAVAPVAVLFFSPSAVEGLRALAIELPPPIVVGAIGRTTAAALRARGYDDVVVPDRPDPALLAEAIRRRMTIPS